jgi:hypothetical protein
LGFNSEPEGGEHVKIKTEGTTFPAVSVVKIG